MVFVFVIGEYSRRLQRGQSSRTPHNSGVGVPSASALLQTSHHGIVLLSDDILRLMKIGVWLHERSFLGCTNGAAEHCSKQALLFRCTWIRELWLSRLLYLAKDVPHMMFHLVFGVVSEVHSLPSKHLCHHLPLRRIMLTISWTVVQQRFRKPFDGSELVCGMWQRTRFRFLVGGSEQH